MTAWAALEAELSASVLAASGYEIHGWAAEAGRWSKAEDRVEQTLVLKLGVVHPEV